jgi:exopolysaccharide biosynthesis protein
VEDNPKQTPNGRPGAGSGILAAGAVAFVLLLAGGSYLVWRPGRPRVILGTQTNAIASPATKERGPAINYIADVIEDVPWTVHIVKVDRLQTNYFLETTMGKSNTLGMTLVSDQVKTLPPELGKAMAAVNGDFYRNSSKYPGDPEGIQIAQGELVSGPRSTHSCFWIDAAGGPHITNVQANFKVTLPDGRVAAFELNEQRPSDGVVLYTRAIGASTRTSGGVELVLGPTNASALPLAVGSVFSARVREVRRDGNSAIPSDGLVLSVGPKIASQVEAAKSGDMVTISTATVPDMAGSRTAIGGGPALVRGGLPLSFSGLQTRHPRTAIGWNKEYFFLVEVDGRQKTSAGMSFSELAAYMAKLGCEEANNLDGGGSATMWVRGVVMNNPSEGRERPAANALVVVRKDSRD